MGFYPFGAGDPSPLRIAHGAQVIDRMFEKPLSSLVDHSGVANALSIAFDPKDALNFFRDRVEVELGLPALAGVSIDFSGNGKKSGDGKPASKDEYTFAKKDGQLEVTDSSGKITRVRESALGKNARFYPESHEREEENARIEKLIFEKGGLSKAGKIIIPDLRSIGLDNTDIFHGSHVLLEDEHGKGDGGELYRKWKDLPGAEKRTSSHYSSETQYQIKVGPGDAVVLIGVTDNGNTWLQLERSPGRTGSTAKKILSGLGSGVSNLTHGELSFDDAHGKDYDLYKKIRQNIGPFGVSPHSDKNPVRVEWTR